ncbi:hypothetical protein KAS08_04225 [Candidatus Pacearchaeota archaeon]|nr:hypothetical protein [Candidatus Pacearchaeota archaeon]
MNKRCMLKVGAAKLGLVLALVLTTSLFFILLTSATPEDIYTLGEKVKVDIGEIGNYIMTIQTPEQTFLYESNKTYFIFKPDYIGDYIMDIKGDESSKQIEFKVLDKADIPKYKTVEIPLEEIEIQVPDESVDESQSNVSNCPPPTNSILNQIKVGEDVKWKEEIASGNNIQIKIPEISTNILISSKNSSIDFKIKNSLADNLANLVIEEKKKTIAILQVPENTNIEYITPAPIKKEKIISKKIKEVEISSDLHYKNVLAFTNLTEELPFEKESSINVYWKEEKKFLPFKAYDTNNNSLLDKIEWTVPHLSTQTFEIIIEITHAQHLDENRQVIEDIYEAVSKKDDIWQEITAGHYARVTFEKLLTSKNDITIYAKSSDPNATVEVYEKNGTEKIADFGIINENKKYQIFLTNLQSMQDTFDLLILGGTIMFDLIIDPWFNSSIFYDSFESTSPYYYDAAGNWSRDTNAWDRNTQSAEICGSAAAHVDGTASATQYITMDAGLVNLSGAKSANISFYWRCDSSFDANDYFSYDEYYSGAWHNDVFSYDLGACTGSDWTYYERIISGAELQSDFAVRFATEANSNQEDFYIDCFEIKKEIFINMPPIPTPQINSTDGTNKETQDLNCFDTLHDPDGDSINVSIRWYKNEVLNLSIDYNNSYLNGTFFNAILLSSNTTNGDNWTCSMRGYDGIDYSTWVNSSSLSVIDPGIPIEVNIVSPTPQSYSTSNIYINVTTNKITDWCGYSLDGAANVTMTKINDTFFSDIKSLSGGEYSLEIYCNDTFGLYNSSNTTFLVDTTQYESIGEWGVVEDIPTATWNTVSFQHSFREVPVVVHQIDYGYDYDDNPCTTRVRAITKDGFQIRTDSWSEAASCPSTGINGYWLAMEKGIHNVSNAGTPVREVEVVNFTMDVDACGSGANPVDWTYAANHRPFQNSWDFQPLVLAAVQTANDVDPISQYLRGCTNTNSDTWNTTCIEIGLNGMENDEEIRPCELHTQNEEGGYIAWEMDSDWSNSETRDNTGTSGDGVTGYSWEAYWENDNVAGSQNDPYPMSNYFVTLSQSYEGGIALGSGIRVDGTNGVFPTVHYSAPSNIVYLLSDEDQFGDEEQQHTPEPYELLFFNSSTGFLYSEKILNMMEVDAPINNTIYGSSTVNFEVSTLIDSDSCWFSLDGAANTTMDEVTSKNFDYSQSGLSDTTHNVTFYCNNTYGGEYSSEQYFFSVDSAPLIINAIQPLAQTYNTSNLNFIVNTSKPVSWCSYSLNGATNVSMTQINSTYFSAYKKYLREGDYDVDYYCGGIVGPASSDSVSFSIDIGTTENVSRGTTILPDGSSEVNITFPTQDLSKAFLLFSFRSASSGPNQIQILGELMEDKINFRRYSSTGDVYIEWTVVESQDLYVQRGSNEYSTGDSSDTTSIRQINLTESFATISNRLNSGTTSQNVQGFWSSKFNSATQIAMSRGTTGTTGEFHWQAIEWDDSKIQSGFLSGTGVTSPQALTNTVNTSRSFLTFSSQIAGQTSLQETFIRGYFTDSDNIEFYKNTGSATHGISWFVVENNRFTTQSGLTSVAGATAVNANINQIELNKSFSLESHTSTGGGTTFANAFTTNKILNTTTIQFQKGTGSQTQNTNWFVIALGEAPVDFLSIISPKAQTYSTTTIDFNVTLTDAGSWCAYSLDGAANVTMTSLNSTYFYYTQIGLSSTTHNMTFYCNDTLGTMYESNNVVFDIDTSPPTVTSISPANQTTNTTNTLYFSYNATDNSGVDSCSLIANEEIIWTDTSIAMGTLQFFEVYLDNGIYIWYINCSDDGGLTSSSESRQLNVSGPQTYNWGNRFYETSTIDFTSAANIGLANSRDATENTVSMTLPASAVTTVTIAKTPYLGNGGAIIPSSTIIDFSAPTTVSTSNVGYLTWKLYVENSSGNFLICQSGDDFTSGTRMSSLSANWDGTCNSPAYDLVLKKSDRIKMVLNVYNSDTSTLDFTHTWDDDRWAYVNLMTFTVLGALSTDLVYPTSNVSIARESTTNVTCEASCSVGNCPNTNAYIQRYNGTDWLNIGSSGSLILNTGETNPHSLGSVSSAVQTNFTLRGNAASFNDIRCIATSTYSSATGTTTQNIEVEDSNMPPNIYLTNPVDTYIFNTSQVTLFYNASDENNNIANTTLILNGQENMTNASIIINNQINNFTISLLDGNYNWTVNTTDTLGETATDATARTFTIDTILPQMILHNPIVDESLGSVSVNFNFTALDNLDSNLTCDLILDGAIIETGFSAINSSYTNLTKTVGLGDHLWNISCQDNAGNLNFSETRNFTVSDTPPTVELLTADLTWFDSSSVDLEYNVTDNDQIENCSLYINGIYNQTNSTPIIQGASLDFSIVGVLDGEYNWSVSCIDNANLVTSTINQTFYVDTTAPVVNLNLPVNLTISPSPDVNFNFTALDNLDSNLTCDLIMDSNILVPAFSATNNTLTNNLITGLVDGAHTWNVNCTDEAGNVGESSAWTITIESYPAVTLNTSDHSWFSSDLELKYIPTDNTNFSNCSLIINDVYNRTNLTSIINGAQNIFSVDDFSDGIYNWSINCTDTYGLTSSAGVTRTAYRDSLAPSINLSTPTDGENVFSGNVEFNFTPIDNLSENMTCNLTVDGTVIDSNFNVTNSTLTNRTNLVFPGTHFWNVTCWDMAGSEATSLTWNFTNFEAPSVSLESPENNTWLNYSTSVLEYYIIDSDDNIANCSLYLDGIYNQTNSTPVINDDTNNFTLELPEGKHNWTVECIDATGLTGTDNYRNINIDTQAPIIITSNPLPDEILDWNNVTFNFTIQDNLDDALNCTLIINAFPEVTNIVAPNNTQTIEYFRLHDGNHTWQLQCLDEAGNHQTSPLRNFTVDAPPRVTLNSPPNDNITTLSTITFNYTPEDAYPLTQCSIYLDGILNDTDAEIETNFPNFFTITGITEGKHNWTVECLDSDANTYAPPVFTLSRDLSPPIIILNAPDNDTALDANEDVLFNWTGIDLLGSWLTCDLVIDGQVNDSGLATSGFPRTESIGGFSIGTHYWNVTCWDTVGNSNTSETREFEYSYPDFMVNESTILFSTLTPTEGESITINATVYNVGASPADSVEVEFYLGDPALSGTQIGATQIISIDGSSSNTTQVNWDATMGTSQIYVVVDYNNLTTENNETNNKISEPITIGSWHFFYGDINADSSFTLSDSSNYEVNKWNLTDFSNANIYVSDYDSNIDWLSLQAIGRDTSNNPSSNDITEIDSILGSATFVDSLNSIYMNGTEINETLTYQVFGNTIQNVPVATSITSANFKTGILWDTSDDSDTRYNSTDKEDIVFVTKVNQNTAGSYEVTDYEMRVPALLREYDNTNSETAIFYVEIN